MSVRRPAVALSALLLALTACSGDDAGEAGDPAENGTHGGDHGGDAMSMNDPDATPADEAEGEVAEGQFIVLDTAPPDSDFVAGQAFLAQASDGTTVTVRLTGLTPNTDYLAHLHALPCAQDNGGEHFAFDPDGPEVPPNEVHLAFTSDDFGDGEATVTNPEQVGDDAPSVVVHPADAMDNRLACADF